MDKVALTEVLESDGHATLYLGNVPNGSTLLDYKLFSARFQAPNGDIIELNALEPTPPDTPKE